MIVGDPEGLAERAAAQIKVTPELSSGIGGVPRRRTGDRRERTLTLARERTLQHRGELSVFAKVVLEERYTAAGCVIEVGRGCPEQDPADVDVGSSRRCCGHVA